MEVQAILNEITNLFTAIGDFFTKADWYPMVKWPFWILLSATAAGGVYCARFGKKTLLSQAVCCMLNMTVIYLSAAMLTIYCPSVQNYLGALPFLSVSEGVVSLVDPIKLTPGVLSPLTLQLMLLCICVSLAESLSSGGKSIPTWLFFQCLTILGGLAFYLIIYEGLSWLIPAVMNRYSYIPVILVLLIGVLVFVFKLVFTFIFSGGNPVFGSVYRFLTVNKFGALLTVSSLTFLLTAIFLETMHLTNSSVLVYPNVNTRALWITLLMLLVVLYIFGMFYNDKKKS